MMLTILTALPVVGAIFLLAIGDRSKPLTRAVALAFAFASLLLVLILWHGFDSSLGTMQFEQRLAWVPALNIEYHVGIDGLGLLMLLLWPSSSPSAWPHRGRSKSASRCTSR